MCEGVLLLFFMPFFDFSFFFFFYLECSRDVTSLLVDTGNGASLSFMDILFCFVELNSSQHFSVTL